MESEFFAIMEENSLANVTDCGWAVSAPLQRRALFRTDGRGDIDEEVYGPARDEFTRMGSSARGTSCRRDLCKGKAGS